jgi:hypothetical protein
MRTGVARVTIELLSQPAHARADVHSRR